VDNAERQRWCHQPNAGNLRRPDTRWQRADVLVPGAAAAATGVALNWLRQQFVEIRLPGVHSGAANRVEIADSFTDSS
jgi:hypothetical protein